MTIIVVPMISSGAPDRRLSADAVVITLQQDIDWRRVRFSPNGAVAVFFLFRIIFFFFLFLYVCDCRPDDAMQMGLRGLSVSNVDECACANA